MMEKLFFKDSLWTKKYAFASFVYNIQYKFFIQGG